MKIRIIRKNENVDSITGRLEITDKHGVMFRCYTLELPWRDNKKNESCIPTGTYKASVAFSPAQKSDVIWLYGVQGRDLIQIHPGNRATDITGCIIVGYSITVTGKERMMTTLLDSRKAFDTLIHHVPGGKFEIEILEDFE